MREDTLPPLRFDDDGSGLGRGNECLVSVPQHELPQAFWDLGKEILQQFPEDPEMRAWAYAALTAHLIL